MVEAVWLIPALPLAGFLVLLVAGKRIGEPGAGWLATLAMTASFVAAVVTFAGLFDREAEQRRVVYSLFEWFGVGGLRVDVGFLLDPLSITMALFVTGVGALIHLYSIGYMHGDERFSRFFAYLNLFAFSMLMLVLGDNLLLTFLGWEGVGACSYFLIAFWFEADANASAGKKAFITNRVGDVGFMIAMFLAFAAVGSLQYTDVLGGAGGLSTTTATAIALLLFVGAVGKSAQLPLYVWLPDAMAGPTPVSALIHAATMVTSGVYLMTRIAPILTQANDWVPTLIAVVGAATALFGATIAVAQRDIKKVLAYSTVSQLGYMFLAVGTGAYVAAVFHMITHAFFKALLFLGSGSVIHGMHEEQDMRRMGALRKFMPITAATFIVGWLAIAGVPPFAGFWSKDDILLNAWDKSPALWVVGLVTALLTAYYMSRQVFMVFYGEPRWNDQAQSGAHAEDPDDAETAPAPAGPEHTGPTGDPHESPWTMLAPLVVLAVLSAVGGGINLPFSDKLSFLENWLEPVVAGNERVTQVGTGGKVILAAIATLAALLGIALGVRVYLQRRAKAVEPEILLRAWRYDEALTAFMGGPGRILAEDAAIVDRTVVDGAVNGVATLVRTGSDRLRVTQTGYIRNYALGIAAGAVALVGWFLTRASL